MHARVRLLRAADALGLSLRARTATMTTVSTDGKGEAYSVGSSTNIRWHEGSVSQADREKRLGQKARRRRRRPRRRRSPHAPARAAARRRTALPPQPLSLLHQLCATGGTKWAARPLGTNAEPAAVRRRAQGCVLWFTGLSGSGKSTVAYTLEHALSALGKHAFVLDGARAPGQQGGDCHACATERAGRARLPAARGLQGTTSGTG